MASILGVQDARTFLRGLMTADVEEFWAIALDSTKEVLQARMLFRGTVDQCLVHPRDVFRFACLNNAASVIVAHNHPSCDARPSSQDIAFTKQLVSASKLMQIPVLDHLIMTKTGVLSMATEKYCEFPKG